MSNMNQIASDLYKFLTESDSKKPKSYDTKAEVIRVEGEIAWVKIPGGEDETPVSLTTNAKPGDQVVARISGGRAWLLGNQTNPPTDDTVANVAVEQSNDAFEAAKVSQVAAEIAGEAASSAIKDARTAQEKANEATEAAEIADSKAEAAASSASAAQTSADTALRAAGDAQEQASVATRYANSALTQLSVVEDVVGVLTWISEHATYKASTDTQVVAGKMYFTKSGDIYTPVATPTGNPSQNGYYEIDTIDEAVSNYVSSHLSLTSAGLWVINDNNSYKILLASDGMKVYDASGNLVSTFGESITFSSTRAQYIGGENAYIVFNPTTGTMSIGGSNLSISGNVTISGTSKTLSQVLQDMQAEIDGSIETWYYGVDPTTSNPPASGWTTQAQKENHLRDLYFNTTNGHSFRWAYENNEFKWVQIADEDAAAALRAAQAAQQTADNAIKYVEYAVGTSSTSHPTTGWSTTSPVWEEGKYVWMRQSKDGTTYTYTCIQGAKGDTGEDGATIWTTTTAPVKPNYTFTITNLSGPTGFVPKVGDVIVYSYYRYTITTVSSTTVLAGSRTSIRGSTGATGPEAVVTVYPTALDLANSTATLAVILRVNGVITTPSAYSWTKGTETLELATTSTLTVDDLEAVYNCTVTW